MHKVFNRNLYVNWHNGCEVKGELIYMTRAWDKEKSESQQESNPWPPKHRAGTLSTELRELMESKVILTEFICDRHPAYC